MLRAGESGPAEGLVLGGACYRQPMRGSRPVTVKLNDFLPWLKQEEAAAENGYPRGQPEVKCPLEETFSLAVV
jgi:hypothetical protein